MFWTAPIGMMLMGVILLLYNYFIIYIPSEIEVHKLADRNCYNLASICPTTGANYWTGYAVAGWAMILIGLVIGVSYYYIRAIFPRQNTPGRRYNNA